MKIPLLSRRSTHEQLSAVEEGEEGTVGDAGRLAGDEAGDSEQRLLFTVRSTGSN